MNHPSSNRLATLQDSASPLQAPTASDSTHLLKFLSFKLDAEEYGIDILKVQEIRGFERPTRIANAPSYILGVTNLRGVIVPIVDLRTKFGLSQPKYDSVTVTIVLNMGQQVIGMVVDSVSDVVALQAQDIKAAPEFSGAISTEHIIGIATVKDGDKERMMILMDIEQFMTSADIGLISA